MIYSKILGTVAAMALIMPLLAAAPAYAQAGGGGVVRGGGGGGGAVMGGGRGGGGAAMGGGGRSFGGSHSFGGARTSGGRTFAVRPGGGGNWAGRPGRPGWSGSRPGWGHRPGWHHRGHGGFYPGFIGGAIVGSSLAWPYYSDPYYYDYDDVVVAPGGPSADEVAYCSSRFKSYDPRSGTYLGYDGLRHPCP